MPGRRRRAVPGGAARGRTPYPSSRRRTAPRRGGLGEEPGRRSASTPPAPAPARRRTPGRCTAAAVSRRPALLAEAVQAAQHERVQVRRSARSGPARRCRAAHCPQEGASTPASTTAVTYSRISNGVVPAAGGEPAQHGAVDVAAARRARRSVSPPRPGRSGPRVTVGSLCRSTPGGSVPARSSATVSRTSSGRSVGARGQQPQHREGGLVGAVRRRRGRAAPRRRPGPAPGRRRRSTGRTPPGRRGPGRAARRARRAAGPGAPASPGRRAVSAGAPVLADEAAELPGQPALAGAGSAGDEREPAAPGARLPPAAR